VRGSLSAFLPFPLNANGAERGGGTEVLGRKKEAHVDSTYTEKEKKKKRTGVSEGGKEERRLSLF